MYRNYGLNGSKPMFSSYLYVVAKILNTLLYQKGKKVSLQMVLFYISAIHADFSSNKKSSYVCTSKVLDKCNSSSVCLPSVSDSVVPPAQKLQIQLVSDKIWVHFLCGLVLTRCVLTTFMSTEQLIHRGQNTAAQQVLLSTF